MFFKIMNSCIFDWNFCSYWCCYILWYYIISFKLLYLNYFYLGNNKLFAKHDLIKNPKKKKRMEGKT